MADDKTHDALACSQTKATVGNIRSWPSSQKATVITRKESPPIGTVSAMPSARCPSLPPAYRHIVERKGERTEKHAKDTEQGTSPSRPIIWLAGLQRHRVLGISTARPSGLSPGSRPGFLARHRSGRANRSG